MPTQKPLGLLERIVKVHSSPGDTLLDFFAGSGTFGEAAAKHGRPCLLVDKQPRGGADHGTTTGTVWARQSLSAILSRHSALAAEFPTTTTLHELGEPPSCVQRPPASNFMLCPQECGRPSLAC